MPNNTNDSIKRLYSTHCWGQIAKLPKWLWIIHSMKIQFLEGLKMSFRQIDCHFHDEKLIKLKMTLSAIRIHRYFFKQNDYLGFYIVPTFENVLEKYFTIIISSLKYTKLYYTIVIYLKLSRGKRFKYFFK